MPYVVEMLNITKEFPGIKACDNISFGLKFGEIHALLGENGAGKSTLMSVLFGLYNSEAGIIKIKGKEVKITNPNVATQLGIGMVHQHFKLVHNFTVTENIILGNEPKLFGNRINLGKAKKEVKALSKQYGLNVDVDAKIEDITVGMQQRVEILKMLYRNAEILIFDEPTAVLTPQEITDFMEILRELVSRGKTVVIITHKLKEIKAVADRCTIMRKGRYIDTVHVSETTEEELAELMVGKKVAFKVEKQKSVRKEVVLETVNLRGQNKRGIEVVKNVNIKARAGEITCIAGIDGNGQSELVEILTGLMKESSGEILFLGENIELLSVKNRFLKRIGHIPEDRQKRGLVLDYPIMDNMILQNYDQVPFSKNLLLKDNAIKEHGDMLVEAFDVRCAEGSDSLARGLSGGNQQKAIIARELSRNPKLLIAVQPTRGLDVGAIEFIHKTLIKHRDEGNAILLISLELDEVLNVSDLIYVMYEGEIVAKLDAENVDEFELGLYMAGSKRGDSL